MLVKIQQLSPSSGPYFKLPEGRVVERLRIGLPPEVTKHPVAHAAFINL